MGVIYKITNKITNHFYIGSAKDFKVRRNIHLSRLKLKKHHSPYLQRSWYKYGADSFIFEIIEDNIPVENLITREQYWIDLLKPTYNVAKKAGSSLGIKRSEATRNKNRLVQLGRVHPEWRRKLKSEVQGGENHWAYGTKMKESTRQKKSATMLRKYKEGFIPPNTKPVLQFDLQGNFIQEFPSVKAAAQNDDLKRKCITQCIRGASKTSLGFIWKYKNPKPKKM